MTRGHMVMIHRDELRELERKAEMMDKLINILV